MVSMPEQDLHLHELAVDCQSKKLLEMQGSLTGAAISQTSLVGPSNVPVILYRR